MIETIDNITQMAMTGICAGVSLYEAVYRRERAWSLLCLFAGIFFLGDLYWALFLAMYQMTPQFSYISDMSWDASYLFLTMLLVYIGRDMDPPLIRRRYWLWLIPAFTVGMCMFYMLRGDIISNVITAVMMTGLFWHALNGLLPSGDDPQKRRRRRMLYIVVLVFCLAEYGLWTSSCFWMGDTIANIYFWFDFLISFCFLLFLPAVRKAVSG